MRDKDDDRILICPECGNEAEECSVCQSVLREGRLMCAQSVLPRRADWEHLCMYCYSSMVGVALVDPRNEPTNRDVMLAIAQCFNALEVELHRTVKGIEP